MPHGANIPQHHSLLGYVSLLMGPLMRVFAVTTCCLVTVRVLVWSYRRSSLVDGGSHCDACNFFFFHIYPVAPPIKQVNRIFPAETISSGSRFPKGLHAVLAASLLSDMLQRRFPRCTVWLYSCCSTEYLRLGNAKRRRGALPWVGKYDSANNIPLLEDKTVPVGRSIGQVASTRPPTRVAEPNAQVHHRTRMQSGAWAISPHSGDRSRAYVGMLVPVWPSGNQPSQKKRQGNIRHTWDGTLFGVNQWKSFVSPN